MSRRCSSVAEGDILAVSLAESSGTDHLLAALYTADNRDLLPSLVYFKVAAVKPQQQTPLLVDPKSTRVVLQVSTALESMCSVPLT